MDENEFSGRNNCNIMHFRRASAQLNTQGSVNLEQKNDYFLKQFLNHDKINNARPLSVAMSPKEEFKMSLFGTDKKLNGTA